MKQKLNSIAKKIARFLKKTVIFIWSAFVALTRKAAYNREWILLPLFVAAMWVFVKFVVHLTGRTVTDDPSEIVNSCYRAIKVAMVVAFVGNTQDHLFGYRSKTDNPRLRDDIYDSCVTFGLLIFFAYLFWH